MLELFGFQLGTVFQGGTLLVVIGGMCIWWIRGAPDRAHRRNEGDASLRGDLLDRISKLESLQISDRERHERERSADRDACEKQTEELRQRIREQDKLIDGLQRQIIMFQVAAGRALPLTERSPEIEKMLASLSALCGATDQPKTETLKSVEETERVAHVAVEQVKQDEAKL